MLSVGPSCYSPALPNKESRRMVQTAEKQVVVNFEGKIVCLECGHPKECHGLKDLCVEHGGLCPCHPGRDWDWQGRS